MPPLHPHSTASRIAVFFFLLTPWLSVAQAQELGRPAPDSPLIPSRQVAYSNGLLPLSNVLGLTGDGIDILVWESGIPLPGHFALDGADISLEFQSTGLPSEHATQVVGAIVGQGGDCQVHGTAPGATIRHFQRVYGPSSMSTRLQQWEDQLNAGVGPLANWSFTAGGDAQHFAVETITHAHPEHLLILGSGNPSANLWSMLSNEHKNGLVVGSINFQHGFSYGNSGRGPTDDGRIKPDLVEFGQSLRLPALDNEGNATIHNVQGSSMACALVAGQAALLQESAVQQFGETLRGDVLKAILIMTAQDLGPTGPDFQFGFGHMMVDRGVEFITRVHDGCPRVGMQVGELTPGQVDTLAIPNAGGHPLKACLVWMDPPADLEFRHVVNDLNLTLESEAGDQHKPWALPQASVFLEHLDSLELLEALPAVRQTNHVDNVELIEVDALGDGPHYLTVSHDGESDQSYALVWMEVSPTPWSLPATDSEALVCLDAGVIVQDADGTTWDGACGSTLPAGAYCIQAPAADGCHALQSFDVTCSACPGDLDGDAFRGTSDFLLILSLFGSETTFCMQECKAFDLADNNNLVLVTDLIALLGAFGTPCPN